MHKAFRLADVHNNIYRVASGDKDIGSRTLLIGKCPRELQGKYISGGRMALGEAEKDWLCSHSIGSKA